MRASLLSVVLILGGLVGCTSLRPVTDEKTAIRIANRACEESWGAYGRRNGSSWDVRLDQWHARLEGGHWKAWTGDESNPVLSVNVPRDGRPVNGDTSCSLRFQD
jgi:hypothetical protein